MLMKRRINVIINRLGLVSNVEEVKGRESLRRTTSVLMGDVSLARSGPVSAQWGRFICVTTW